MSKPRAKDDPAQLDFVAFLPVMTKNGDGSVTIKAGQPLLKLSAVQLAKHFNVHRESVYRWRSEGVIPEEFVHRAGKVKLLFSAAVIPVLESHFRTIHE